MSEKNYSLYRAYFDAYECFVCKNKVRELWINWNDEKEPMLCNDCYEKRKIDE